MKVIVISDLRALPVAAAVSLKRKLKGQHVELWLSKQSIRYGDHGDNDHFSFLRLLKVSLLKLIFQAKIIKISDRNLGNNFNKIGVESSLKSITRDSLADRAKYPELWQQLDYIYLGAIGIANLLVRLGVQEVYIFNGRIASAYPIAKICKDNSIKTFFYEYSSIRGFYTLLPFSIHNKKQAATYALRHYLCSAHTYAFGYSQGMQYITSKLKNKFTDSYNAKANKTYDVVIFLSSSHEYLALDEEICGVTYINELRFVSEVVKQHGPDKKIAVRCHPNQINDPNWDVSLADLINYCHSSGVDFYPPTSKVSSYDLIRCSNEVAVDRSSIGLDAVFLGAKVSVYSDAYYKEPLNFVTQNDKIPPEDKALELASIIALYEFSTTFRLSPDGIVLHYVFYRLARIFNHLARIFKKE